MKITATEAPVREVTICRECEFAERVGVRDLYRGEPVGKTDPTGHCLNPDAPVSDYVHGFKYCAFFNKGHCQFFQLFLKAEKREKITEEEYKELDSKLKSVIETLEYLVTCNQRDPNVTCYHAHSLNEPIQTLIDAKVILVKR